MIDFEPMPEKERALRVRRLHIRAQIRKHNKERPRCAGCGCDMPKFTADDIVTEEQMAAPGYAYLEHCDFRPGDLVCFWCLHGIVDTGDLYQWGRA